MPLEELTQPMIGVLKEAFNFDNMLGELGFSRDDDLKMTEVVPLNDDGSRNVNYEREESERNPKLKLVMKWYDQHSASVIINSQPFDRKYHFVTDSPVLKDKVQEIVRGYLSDKGM